MAKLNIQDGSGDREFFTIIPNYIANHSTANDQALYLQMKRFAGEDGQCFATEKTLMQRLKIGKKAFDKSLNYLISKNWITFIGTTEGKTRPIKTYKVNNIWQENSEYYKEISAESNISFNKDKSQKERDKFQKQHKISAESNIEEEPIKEDLIKKSRFAPPSLEEVKTYCEERKNQISPQAFLDFYSSKGWLIGKNKMKDWRAAVRTWENRNSPVVKNDEYFLTVGNHKFKTKEEVESASKDGIIKWDSKERKWIG